MRRFGPGLGVVVFFLLVGLAYAMASPYGAPPDEPTHYVKALATGGGDVLGRPARYPGVQVGRQAAYIDSVTRRYRVPERLAPPLNDSELCFILKPSQPADCPQIAAGGREQLSYVGVYPPVPYVVPGVAARLGTDKVSGLLVARVASGLCSLVMVGVAVAALRRRGLAALSLIGIAVVLWPGLMFLAWGLNPNGTEIAASLAFFATMLGLTRDETPPRWLWVAAAGSGFVLSTSRPLAPVWITYGLLVAVTLLGPRAALRRVRAGGCYAVLLVVTLAIGIITTAGWDFVMGAHLQPESASRLELVRPALGTLQPWLGDIVGRLGWGEVSRSAVVIQAWAAALAVLTMVSMAVGSWRQRLACVVTGAAFVVTAVFFFIVTHPSGFPMGARYVQAGMTVQPLLWTEVIVRNHRKLPRWGILPVVVVVISLVGVTQVDALYRNGRRFAVGVGGPADYLLHGAKWNPPGGWWPWIACTALGVIALIVSFGADLLSRGGDVDGPNPAATASTRIAWRSRR